MTYADLYMTGEQLELETYLADSLRESEDDITNCLIERFKKIHQYTLKEFHDAVFEIAFGCGAIEKNYTLNDVIEKLREYSDNGLMEE